MRRGLVLLFPGLLLAFPATVPAQTTGNIEGTITDTSGATLPGVTVEATSSSLQGTRVGVSGREGAYRFPGAPPGLYTIKASLSGFDPVEETVRVSLDATATLDLKMRLSVRESVLVSGEVPLVEVSSTTTGTNYTDKVIERLPVGRNYAEIVRSNPGVLPDRGQTQGRSIALSIYGSTSVEHQWFIDGINTTNVLKGMQGKAINAEFVQEVEVKTGGYQAEYGRALGGIINVITKSGGNTFHGDAFVYYDSAATQAKRVFEKGVDSDLSGMRLAGYRRTDFGVDVGGPVIRDRLWFFAAYDRVEFPAKVSRYASSELVPSTTGFPLDATDNLYSGKLTWNLTGSSTLVATVFADPTTNAGAGQADPRQGTGAFVVPSITSPDPGTWQSSRTIGATDFGLRLNQLFGAAALATFQASRHQDRYNLIPTGPGHRVRIQDFTCAGGTPDAPCDAPPFGAPNFVTGGLGFIPGWTNHSTSIRDQIRADTSLYFGRHEIKLGGDYQDGKTSSLSSFSGGQVVNRFNESGQVYYQHLFYNRSDNLEDLSPVDWNSRAVTEDFGAYAQDSWKAAPGVTINAGLRWDRENILDYRNVAVIKTDVWQPRLGVVWDPKHDGTTKVYAFIGRFSYGLPTDLAVRAYGANFFASTFNFDPADLTPDPNVPGRRSRVFPNTSTEPVDSGLKGISQDELTLGVEKVLASSFSVGFKGTYRRLANAIEDRCDLDYNSPETSFSGCGIVNPGSNGRFARGAVPGCNWLDGDFNQCTDTIPATPPARRIYRGIEVLARKSFSDRFWIQSSYVFSSLRGNYDGEVSEGQGGQTDPGINSDFDYPELFHNSYGRLYLDRPHQARLDGFYVTPFDVTIGVQGWLRSGAPLNKLGYFNSYVGPWSPIQLVPKGYAGRLPTEWDANLTLGYPIRFGPVTATLQAYVYNAFNNQIRTDQDTVWSDQAPADYPASIYDPNQDQNNPNYGKITGRSEPRLFRAAIRVSF